MAIFFNFSASRNFTDAQKKQSFEKLQQSPEGIARCSSNSLKVDTLLVEGSLKKIEFPAKVELRDQDQQEK